MKTFFTILTIVASTICNSQVIDSITISPQQPTTEDTLWFYVHSTFNYGSCEGTSSMSMTGNEINSSSIHCTGILTYICEDIDTFKINPLSEGTYHFNHTLSSGLAPAPCTPGIVADDNETLTFTVQSKLGIKSIKTIVSKVYPNPVTQKCLISFDSQSPAFQTVKVRDVSNRKVVEQEIHSSSQIEIDLSFLKSGVYFCELTGKDGNISEMIKIIKE